MDASDFRKVRTSLLVFALVFAGHLMATENWKKIETKDGVDLYERWVNVNSHLTVKERKAEMVINGDMNSVLKTLSDPSQTKLWMENVSDSYLLTKKSDNVWTSYTYFSLPWPFENRDLICVSNLKSHDSGNATIEMVSMENMLPVKSKVERLTNYKATWKIADLGNGQVYVSFSAMTATPPQYPRFVIDPVVRGAFLRNLIKLRLVLSSN